MYFNVYYRNKIIRVKMGSEKIRRVRWEGGGESAERGRANQ